MGGPVKRVREYRPLKVRGAMAEDLKKQQEALRLIQERRARREKQQAYARRINRRNNARKYQTGRGSEVTE